MNHFKLNTQSLGYFLCEELFKVSKETDLFLNKFNEIDDLLRISKKLNEEEELKRARFFTLCLELFNCAERFCLSNANEEKKELDGFSRMFLASNFKKKDFDEFVKDFSLDFVFTAHPTEVFPTAILKTLNKVEVLVDKLHKAKDPETKQRMQQNLRSKLTGLWLTDEINRDKPSPEDEAKRLLYIFENSLWKASPYFFRRFYFEYKKHFDDSPKHYPKLKFSSWIGGDRDGNPFVTADLTKKIIKSSRRKAIRLVLRELSQMREDLLIKSSHAKFNNNSAFPYKALAMEMIRDLQNHLDKKLEDDVEALEKSIKKRLELMYKTLCKDGAKRIADRKVRSLMDRLNTFGLSPFTLDLRQDSEVHEILVNELKEKKKLSPLSHDILETLKLIKKMKPSPFNGYIISMTRSDKDIKNLKYIFDHAKVELSIIPLFETPDDIRNSLKTLKNSKGLVKQVMWGYSDSTKKGGRLASAWSVYKAQEAAAKRFPELTHFHGRGGSIARGGGPNEHVFKLLPSGLSKNSFRQTFQGEVLQDDFGLRSRAVQTFEDYFVHSTINAFDDKTISKEVRSKLDKLSDTSEDTFKKAFYESDKINSAFDSDSPIDIISTLNLGSRPSKRKSKKLGVSYRAIPWVFSWAQTRGSLPVWYGLQKVAKDLYKIKDKSTFTKSLVSLISAGLVKTDESIFKLYFDKKLTDCVTDLANVKTDFKIKENSKTDLQNEIAFCLHKLQVKLLKKKDKSDLETECEKVVTKGIASYLGKSG